ncbi:hypothetical protein LGV59_11545 [Bacteroides fragilis]|nr:hypothetical protein [Bacteroides fragilis]
MLRHINKGASVEGVYTVSRWEYPVKAIREAIRNAVVHRDYSLTGKDVKIAIYDDMVEITSRDFYHHQSTMLQWKAVRVMHATK